MKTGPPQALGSHGHGKEDFLSQHGILAADSALVTTSRALQETETALCLGICTGGFPWARLVDG